MKQQLNNLLSLKSKNSVLKNNKGMTLLEIMIVLVILGGLIASLVTVVMGRLESARIKETKIQMAELSKALDLYNGDCMNYPTTDQGLGALIEAPTSEPTCSSWGPSPYIRKFPKDAWGKEFIYENQGGTYVIMSLGKDGREGGTGENQDISSENL